MAYTGKVLAEGQLAASKGTLYTVPSSTQTFVKFISLFNTGSTTETVVLYIKPNATSRKFLRVVLAANEWVHMDESFTLDSATTADLIEGETTNATTVDYIICGVESA